MNWQRPSLGRYACEKFVAIFDHRNQAAVCIDATNISRDIVRGDPDVKWDSIKGLENAKRLLKEAVIMPIKYPQYALDTLN